MFAAPGEAIVGAACSTRCTCKVGDRLPLEAKARGWTCASSGATSSPTRRATAIFDRRSVPAAALARFGPEQYELQLRDARRRTRCRAR
jgi:hypothetical protein